MWYEVLDIIEDAPDGWARVTLARPPPPSSSSSSSSSTGDDEDLGGGVGERVDVMFKNGNHHLLRGVSYARAPSIEVFLTREQRASLSTFRDLKKGDLIEADVCPAPARAPSRSLSGSRRSGSRLSPSNEVGGQGEERRQQKPPQAVNLLSSSRAAKGVGTLQQPDVELLLRSRGTETPSQQVHVPKVAASTLFPLKSRQGPMYTKEFALTFGLNNKRDVPSPHVERVSMASFPPTSSNHGEGTLWPSAASTCEGSCSPPPLCPSRKRVVEYHPPQEESSRRAPATQRDWENTLHVLGVLGFPVVQVQVPKNHTSFEALLTVANKGRLQVVSKL